MIEKLEARRLLSNGPIINPFGSTIDLSHNTRVVSNKTVSTGVGGVNAGTSITYTYFGDSSQLDTGSFDLSSGYDGLVNGDDYFLIDQNYFNQGNGSSSNLGLGGVSAVGGTETDFTGTAKSDRISITLDPIGGLSGYAPPLLVTINGKSQVTYERNLRISANAGDDSILIDLGQDAADMHITIYGAAGNDTIIGGAEVDRIFAGDGNDIVTGGDGKDTIYGEAGDDSIRGGGSNDLIDGGDGADTLRGDAGNDNLSGGANADRLRGSLGNDTLNGGGGRDFLAGEDGDDSLMGGAGEDVCDGGLGADDLLGGPGHDEIFVSDSDHDHADPDELLAGESVDQDLLRRIGDQAHADAVTASGTLTTPHVNAGSTSTMPGGGLAITGGTLRITSMH